MVGSRSPMLSWTDWRPPRVAGRSRRLSCSGVRTSTTSGSCRDLVRGGGGACDLVVLLVEVIWSNGADLVIADAPPVVDRREAVARNRSDARPLPARAGGPVRSRPRQAPALETRQWVPDLLLDLGDRGERVERVSQQMTQSDSCLSPLGPPPSSRRRKASSRRAVKSVRRPGQRFTSIRSSHSPCSIS